MITAIAVPASASVSGSFLAIFARYSFMTSPSRGGPGSS
jgi:hypothetical protein